MRYRHFLFDLDDTLVDYKAAEQVSFSSTMQMIGVSNCPDGLLFQFQQENEALWREFQTGAIAKEWMRLERFRRAFAAYDIDADPASASEMFVECLAETVIAVDGAEAVCSALSKIGEVAIFTNGIEDVQRRRLAKSGLGDHISFIATSEAAGFSKPDRRFFEHWRSSFRDFDQDVAIMIGDRLETDIAGAIAFQIHSCWYNPCGDDHGDTVPTFQINKLNALISTLSGSES